MISMSSGAASASWNIALACASVICSADWPGLSWVWKVNSSRPLTVAMKARRSRFTAQYIQARGCGMTS